MNDFVNDSVDLELDATLSQAWNPN